MKIKFIALSAVAMLALAGLVTGCSTSSTAGKAQSTESLLMQSGFRVVPAGTAAQLQQVQSLPAGKITPVQRHGKTYYIYPDSTQRQLFVGNQSQYQAYRGALSPAQRKTLDDALNNSPASATSKQWQSVGSDESFDQWRHAGWGPWNIAE